MKSRITLWLTLNLTLAAIGFAAEPSATPSPEVANSSSPEIQSIGQLDKRASSWKISQLTQTTAPSSSPEAWLVGSWRDEADDTKVETTVYWTQGQNFLTRRFHVHRTDGQQTEGWEVIGWDSVTQQIRSWVFDSNGGFGDRFWAKEANRWLVETVSTLPDGTQSTAQNVITKVDDDHYTWESGKLSADGVLLPGAKPITVARVGEH